MYKEIQNILYEIEKQEKIHILFACESGSRAWNLHEKNSDYDIRCIYKHEKEWYLQLYEGRDVIESSFNSFEVVGWDLKKALRLLNKSNPTLMEWLYSPIIYRNNLMFTEELKRFASQSFSPYSVLHHYLSMAKKNYIRLKQADSCTAKMYLSILKPLQICYWIIEKDDFPPIGLHIFHTSHVTQIIEEEMKDVILQKQSGQNFTSKTLLHYIESSIKTLGEFAKDGRKNASNISKELTDFFIKMIN